MNKPFLHQYFLAVLLLASAVLSLVAQEERELTTSELSAKEGAVLLSLETLE